MVIAFSQGSLFLAFGHRSRFPFEHSTRRYVFATATLVVVWLVMLGTALLAQYADLDPNAFMPPLERLAHALTLLVLAWAFLSADFVRWRNRSNLIVFGLTLALALLYLSSARSWLGLHQAGAAFNATGYALVWSAVPILVAAAGLFLALFNIRHILDAPLKSLFFLLVILGNGWDLLQLSQTEALGNYLGGARLAYVSGLLLLPLIVYRLAVALLENSLVEVVLAASQPSSAIMPAEAPSDRPASAPLLAAPSSWNFAAAATPTDSRFLLHAIGVMLDRKDQAELPRQIVKATLESLRADVCVLVQAQDNNYADIIAGYDQVAEEDLTGISLNLAEQPTMLDALKRGEQTILFPEYHASELEDLFRRLNISAASSTYVQPLNCDDGPVAAILLSTPYQQVELSPDDMESLREIGFVAGNVLAWSLATAQSTVREEERTIEEIAAKSADSVIDQDEVAANRQELEGSLAGVIERITRLRLQIAELRQQLQQQHIRLLDAYAESDSSAHAMQRLTASFDEQSQLSDACQLGARELLDAETILRIRNLGGGDTLAQIIREYMHKEHNLLLTLRDRLRRQINGLLVSGRSAEAGDIDAILQSVADETAQLELEREQHQRRLNSIVDKLDSLGVDSSFSNLTKVLLQLYAERKTHAQHMADVNDERAALINERQKLLAEGGVDAAELERQLKHLSADHEQLLNAREEMRREQQELLAQIEAGDLERAAIQSRNAELQRELSEQIEGQDAILLQIDGLAEERDNLLKIRDQLAAKVAASSAEAANPESAAAKDDIAELQSAVERLTQQREQLALELSDARSALAAIRQADQTQASDILQSPADVETKRAGLLSAMLGDLRAPIGSMSDYTNLLLAETIGILGAAQLQVLRMISAEIGQLTALIAELEGVAALDAANTAASFGEMDLVTIVEDVIRERSQQLIEKGVFVELALADHLPPVGVDGATVKHILTQLIMNASRVSTPGAQITVSARSGRVQLADASKEIDGIEISVRDQGGGIQPEDLPRIFARKYRSDNPEIPGYGETGVGLTIARAYARAKFGDLWVTSRPGEGSEFHLALPVPLAVPIED